MKVLVEMMLEVSERIEAYELEGHIADALMEYTGNDIEFLDVDVKSVTTIN